MCFVISWMTLLPFILTMFWFLVLQLKNMRPIYVGFSINCENTHKKLKYKGVVLVCKDWNTWDT